MADKEFDDGWHAQLDELLTRMGIDGSGSYTPKAFQDAILELARQVHEVALERADGTMPVGQARQEARDESVMAIALIVSAYACQENALAARIVSELDPVVKEAVTTNATALAYHLSKACACDCQP